jgi:hypothetical protein
MCRIFSEISEALEEERRREDEDAELFALLLRNSLDSLRIRLGRWDTVFMTERYDERVFSQTSKQTKCAIGDE